MIELRPGSFINKGGELMARAIVAEFGDDAELAAEPWIAPYTERARLGLHQKLWVRRLGPAAGLPAALLPRRLRRTFGIAGEPDIAAVLDASGFRYTDDDRYGSRSAKELARNATRWHGRGTRVVLLPQALGPFRTAAVRDPFLRAMDGVDLVFARDRRSLEHLEALVPNDERIRRAPDFTMSLEARRPADLASRVGSGPFAGIVPNDRMLERTSRAVMAAYVDFLGAAVRELATRGIEPVVILHESAKDLAFVDRLAAAGLRPRVVQEVDPLVLKGILGAATVVVSSRYHALVSAMSQAVPVIATGWSHKYEELLEDFGVPEQMLEVTADHEPLRAAIGRAVAGTPREAMVATLAERAAAQKREIAGMWSQVRGLLGMASRSGAEAIDGGG